jgi:O-antigen ligase
VHVALPRMRLWPQRLSLINALLLCIVPLFVLTLKGWANAVLFASAILSLLLLWRGALPRAQLAEGDRAWVTALLLSLVAPVVAVALSAALRGDARANQFDAASRFLLGVPVFLYVLRARLDAARRFDWLVPLSLLVAWLTLELLGRAERWPAGRDTTPAVDPLVFGYLSLAFGLMCLISITPALWKERRWASLAWRGAAFVLGAYLSVRSGSRTGWAAVPIVMTTWLYLNWGRGHPVRSLLVLLAACAAPVAVYLLVPTVHARVYQAWQEIVQYPWTGVAPYTSVGLRITYLRVAADLFALHPWAGIGDTSHTPVHLLPTFSYASPEAHELAYHAAFHNQVVSNGVRFGLGGLLSAMALLLVPLAICIRQLRCAPGAQRRNAAIGFAYLTTILVSSFSTEVVDLKFLASLYAVMVAVLCGSALAVHEPAIGPAS